MPGVVFLLALIVLLNGADTASTFMADAYGIHIWNSLAERLVHYAPLFYVLVRTGLVAVGAAVMYSLWLESSVIGQKVITYASAMGAVLLAAVVWIDFAFWSHILLWFS